MDIVLLIQGLATVVMYIEYLCGLRTLEHIFGVMEFYILCDAVMLFIDSK